MHLPPPSLGLQTVVDGSLSRQCPKNCVFQSTLFFPPPPVKEEEVVVEEEVKEEEEEEDNGCWASYGRSGKGRRRFPPAIPLLARTANLSCHMPWVLKRTYRADGSLMIQEVRVKHHEYFKARRVNGRLTLRLIEMDENGPLIASGVPKCGSEEKDRVAVDRID